jgi:uncharacterized membrane protein
MKTQSKIEVTQIGIVASMFILAALVWNAAPERIPVHWTFNGDIDRYGSRFEGLLGLPLVTLVIYLLLRFLPRIDPGRSNYRTFFSAYAIVRTAVLVFFAGTYALVLLSIRGGGVNIGTAVPILVGALLIVIGGVIGKVRPNWFVGIRTPWTLSSKTAWVRTHRIGGWLFILLGVSVVIASPAFGPDALRLIIPIGVVGIIVWSFVYSYLVWRSDANKVAPAGTAPDELDE